MKIKSFRVRAKTFVAVWTVNQRCLRLVKPIAAEFGLTVEKFLESYTLRQLPGQPGRRTDRALDAERARIPHGFIVRCSNLGLRNRLERVAKFSGHVAQKSVTAFAWDAVMSMVQCCEEDMIFSPKTGRVIGDETHLETFVRRAHVPVVRD